MSAGKPFFDSNILLYTLSVGFKADRADALLATGGVISVQVLNEFASVAFRKLKISWPEIRIILTSMRGLCEVVPVTVEIHETGLAIAARYGFDVYDCMIVAAAIQAECPTVYSEDMQHGQTIDSVTILNPFR
jgi:predicted nucleic acid-binding protein